jgi:hypothetical protein
MVLMATYTYSNASIVELNIDFAQEHAKNAELARIQHERQLRPLRERKRLLSAFETDRG